MRKYIKLPSIFKRRFGKAKTAMVFSAFSGFFFHPRAKQKETTEKDKEESKFNQLQGIGY